MNTERYLDLAYLGISSLTGIVDFTFNQILVGETCFT